ncbi:cellulosomal scaffoldin anchoring protein, putative [Trichomonas vaginalis G3]|uniref:Cellulosomal scaffoldin anchoring protein, putative n=1 Tax=Trichomonas vaginalis (strain ATCC PRA-98 / G3) TaxID=412133 RepID=A2DSN0_TRIV3|nr:bifunctional inhibitor/lipid-transfer protein/seed storage 2s albumin superfamily protein family [Trichomonas vaginalis G3]EAY16610.1 cellulosomal scaffoldin anchoring protein, putative [Trichomonas vaginalis G3]KAI5532987.1 bifunctional inhibitor/lipid-transfer protein/seed storage 2s albumin superfamily protein family [Trichomonas vaginalis G3]|eukprot:XP_001328833.1 cellulosomal scaffoldin anchoring protein [Trichomonas vaginalis G3]
MFSYLIVFLKADYTDSNREITQSTLNGNPYNANTQHYLFQYVTFSNINHYGKYIINSAKYMLKMEHCSMYNCQTSSEGVIYANNAQRIELSNFCFKNCVATATNGAVLHVITNPSEITKIDNVAISGVNNGYFGIDGRRCEIRFLNSSYSSPSLQMLNIVSLNANVFANCYCIDSTSYYSGALYLENMNGNILRDALFYKNKNNALVLRGCSASISNCGFAYNEMDISLQSSSVTVYSSLFTDFTSNNKYNVNFGDSYSKTKGEGIPQIDFNIHNPLGDSNRQYRYQQIPLDGPPYAEYIPTPIYRTIIVTHYVTAYETPFSTAVSTAYETPFSTAVSTAYETPYTTAHSTAAETVFETPFSTASTTAYETPYTTVHSTAAETAFDTPSSTASSTAYETPYTTVFETPYQTVYETPYTTVYQTVFDTPYSTAFSTVYQTASMTPFSTAYQTACETPFTSAFETAHQTVAETPFSTAYNTAKETPGNTPNITPELSAKETPMNTPYITMAITPNDTPYITPSITNIKTPHETAAYTPDETFFRTPYLTVLSTVHMTAHETPVITFAQTPEITPVGTVNETPFITANETPEYTPVLTPLETPSKTRNPNCVLDEEKIEHRKRYKRIKVIFAFGQGINNI